MRKNTFFLILLLLSSLFLFSFFSGCLPTTPVTVTGTIHGYVAQPNNPKDLTGYTPIPGATVTIIDAQGITHTVLTDENGYYHFDNFDIKPNTIINITKQTEEGIKVFKDIVPLSVLHDEDYDAGIADALSTAIALVVEELIKLGMPQKDINLDEITSSDGFNALKEEVEQAQGNNQDINSDPIITAAEEIAYKIVNSPGTLDHFIFSTIANQTAGTAFSITITAHDANNNTVTSYTGTNTLSDTTGTISPDTTGSFTNGIWTGNVTITKAQGGVSITTGGNGKTGTSNNFNLTPGTLDHIVISPDSATIEAGATQVYIAEAFDAYNNSLGDVTAQTTFTVETGAGGSWLNNTYTSATAGTWTVTGTYDTKTDTAALTVNPAALDKFVFNAISDQTAGTAFSITITAHDANNNTVTSYTGTNTLSDTTGTISPDTTGSFTNGIWTGNVTITKAQGGVSITTGGNGKTGTSNNFNLTPGTLDHIVISPDSATIEAGATQVYIAEAFDAYNNSLGDVTAQTTFTVETGAGGSWLNNTYTSATAGTWTVTGTYDTKTDTAALTVNPAALDKFVFNAISDQTAGTAFSITITAHDANNNTVTSYTGTNTLSDTTGTISPDTTGSFTNGIWTGNVTITKAQGGVSITTGGNGKTGTSNNFNLTPGTLDHIVISPDSATIEAGATQVYIAEAFDAYNNSLGDVTAQTTFTVETGAGGSWLNNTYTSATAGTWTVTGTYDTKTDTAALTVNLPPVHNISQNKYYHTIQAALDDVNGDNIIEVVDGTYNESIIFPGGGKKTILQNVVGGNPTIVGVNNSPTVTIAGSSVGTMIKGFTITHTSGSSGSGINILGGSYLIVDNCNISNNKATGIYNNYGTLTIRGASTISNNTANYYGGGINNYGTVTIEEGSTISNNTANYDGGGINNYGTLTIRGASTISNNTANYYGGYGGGINNYGTVTIEEGSTISNNTAYKSGGGIYNSGNITIQEESTISDNSATYGGGIYNNNYGTVTIQGSTISNNTANYNGGAIDNSGDLLNITSSFIENNSCGGGECGHGGGIFLNAVSTNVTIGAKFATGYVDEFNTFTDNKKGGSISTNQHIHHDNGGDCHEDYPNNYYNTSEGPLVCFIFDLILNQLQGETFTITITAKAANDNTYTGYTGINELKINIPGVTEPNNEYISPTKTGNFINGVWTGEFTINIYGIGISIYTINEESGKDGTSNKFNVGLHFSNLKMSLKQVSDR